ncbi:MAG: hypothetical protein HC912_03010 [Saprospiraceae bacterium]|nr:hypothetical protein [Saprospiraceae bacterium]
MDTKADPDTFSKTSYYMPKTQMLLDFGVEQVLWLYTDTEKVMVAQPNQPWWIVNWTNEIEVLGQKFTIQQIIRDAESES